MADPVTLYAIVHHIEDAVEFANSESMSAKDRVYWAVASIAAVEEAFARRSRLYEALPYAVRDKPDDQLAKWLYGKLKEAMSVIEAHKDEGADEAKS